MSSNFIGGTVFPEARERVENAVSTVRESRAWSLKYKIGIPVFSAWVLLSYVGPIESDVPAPLDGLAEIAGGIEYGLTKIDDWAENPQDTPPGPPIPSSTESSSQLETATTTETMEQDTASLPQIPSTVTIPPINDVSGLTPPSSPASNPETPTPATFIPAPAEVPQQYSAAAGSVICSGEVIAATIDLSLDTAPLTQIATATGEPWDQGVAPHDDDNQLYTEVLASRIDNTDGTFTVFVRSNCIGLEQ
jgi:hypothetical protein